MASYNSLNKVMIMGRLGRDPEIRYSANNFPIANFSVATSENVKDQSGNYVEKTTWHNIVVLGNQAENCSKFLKKGSMVFVEGRIQNRKYQDKNGIEKYVSEIISNMVRFLDSRESSQGQYQSGGGAAPQERVYSKPQQQGAAPAQPEKKNRDEFNKAISDAYNSSDVDDDDDLPF